MNYVEYENYAKAIITYLKVFAGDQKRLMQIYNSGDPFPKLVINDFLQRNSFAATPALVWIGMDEKFSNRNDDAKQRVGYCGFIVLDRQASGELESTVFDRCRLVSDDIMAFIMDDINTRRVTSHKSYMLETFSREQIGPVGTNKLIGVRTNWAFHQHYNSHLAVDVSKWANDEPPYSGDIE